MKPPSAHVVTLTTDAGEKFAVSEERHPSRSYGKVFTTTFTEDVAALANRITSGATLRVLLILPQHLSYTTWKRLDQVKVGEQLNLDQASISRALSQLLKEGVVERQGSGSHLEWRLSSDYGWKGDVASYHAHRRTHGNRRPSEVTKKEPTKVAEDILCQLGAPETSRCGLDRAGPAGSLPPDLTATSCG
jgi:hypothetical protein